MSGRCNNYNGDKNVTVQNYYEHNGRRYLVDGKNVMIDYSQTELKAAKWLSRALNKKVTMLPKINIPKGIKTADYLINGERWDLKEIRSNSITAMYTRIRGQERQASNFIFDISKSKLSINGVKNQIEHLYKIKSFNWLNNVIIRKNNDIEIIRRK